MCVCIAQDIYFYKSRAVCASRSIGTSYIYIYIRGRSIEIAIGRMQRA